MRDADLPMERSRRTTRAARKSPAAPHRTSITHSCCCRPNAAARFTRSMRSAASSMISPTTAASPDAAALLARWREELDRVYGGVADARGLARASADNVRRFPYSAPIFRGDDRRRRDGSLAQALRRLCGTRALLPSRGVRGGPHLHRDFRLRESRERALTRRDSASPFSSPTSCATSSEDAARGRIYLAARRSGALRGHRGRDVARRIQSTFRAPDGIRSGARARILS